MHSSSIRSQSRRAPLILPVLWLGLVLLLAGWWSSVIYRQGERIALLETQLGKEITHIEEDRARTRRMLLWESSSLLALLTFSTLFLVWMDWRDRRRARSLQSFFASFTHEIRTPLSSVRLQAESLADRLASSDWEAKALLDRLLEDTVRLEAQVGRALELARVEGGGKLSARPVSLRAMIERFTQNAPVRISLEIGDFSVIADPNAVQLIVRNLIENTLRHSSRANPQLNIRATKHGSMVRVTFQDNGEGAQTRNLGNLFVKGPQSSGAGVGLYLIKSLMAAMGGSAIYNSHPGFRTLLEFREAAPDE